MRGFSIVQCRPGQYSSAVVNVAIETFQTYRIDNSDYREGISMRHLIVILSLFAILFTGCVAEEEDTTRHE